MIDFFDIVRTIPAYFRGKTLLLAKFCTFLNHDAAWSLAIMVAPELRYPQTFDTSIGTPLNHVLKRLHHRRPPAPVSDPSNSQEKLLLLRRITNSVMYIVTEGRGTPTEEEIIQTDTLAEQASTIISEWSQCTMNRSAT